jgi:HD-like signal output (HDOD) protein
MTEGTGNQLQTALSESIQSGKLPIPVLPKAANEIMMMTQDPDSDISTLSKLIHQDQSIASSVLRIANSAAFASAERIVSLQQAVTRLGMQLLSEIAISVAVKSNVFNSPKYAQHIRLMWRHALASALFGKEIARSLRRNVEGQYLCGLLHAIGKPVVLKVIESLEKELSEEVTQSEVMELVEKFHVEVGSQVTAEWKLPQTIQVSNRYYLEYESAPEFKIETAITYLADRIATVCIFPDKEAERKLLFETAFEFLNIYPEDRKTLLDRREEIMKLVASMDF